jgi:AAA domain
MPENCSPHKNNSHFTSSTCFTYSNASIATLAGDAVQPDAPPRSYRDHMIDLLCDEDDESFSEELPALVKTDKFGPHDTLLWEPRVLARLCALSDPWFTSTVLTLAQPEYVGLDLLFDERLLPRLAALRNGHLRGTFLPYTRHLPGFDVRDFLRELRRTQQHQREHLAVTGTPVVVSMDTVKATPVTWLWWPYIALGKLTMLDGDPGIGKSLLMTQLAANLSRGNPLPDQEGKPTIGTGGAHVTVMLSTEDGLADTLKPRLDAAGADSSKIKVLTSWVDADGEEHVFSFQDMPMLERALQTYDPRLVIIDPLQAYLGSGVDMHRANETRPLLEALRRLAEAYHCAIVCIRHPAKSSQGGKALHRGLGSVDFIGAARTGLFVEQHPTDPTKALLAQSKSNIGPLGRTLMFTKEAGQFEWCGRSRLSAEMLAGSGRGPDPHAFLEAVVWLERRLEEGVPVASTLIREEAEEDGITFPTLRRAKKALGVRSMKHGEQWEWQLPALRVIPQPTPLCSLASFEHHQENQEGSAITSAPEGMTASSKGIEMSAGCGCLSLHPPGACPPQVAEIVEEAQDTQAEQVAERAEGPEATPPAILLPTFCRSCHKRVRSWLDRGAYYQCAHWRCPGKVLKR